MRYSTQRILRLIDEIELEPAGTARDRIYRAEKKGLIANAKTMIESRMLRNDIAHEYVQEELTTLYHRVLKLTPVLFDSVERVKKHAIKTIG